MTTEPTPLSRREREILHVLFAFGRQASAEEIREQLTRPPSYSAVRAMLTRLEAKGQIRHRADGPRYLYAPTTPRPVARRTAVLELVRVFFDGSHADAAAALLSGADWSDEELATLAGEIERIRQERRGASTA